MDQYLTAEELSDILVRRVQELAPEWLAHQTDLRSRLLDALADDPTALLTTMTYEEFLAGYDGVHAEWINGKVIRMSPASRRHQQLVAFLVSLINECARPNQLGEALPAPFQMKLAGLHRGREPDILFVAAKHLDRLQETYLDGPADLVVEIVSEESIGRDRGEKFTEYEAAGIPEYWLIDPIREQVEFYQLAANRRYALASLDRRGVYHSKVIDGFRLPVDWLWRQTLPSVLETLTQLNSSA